MKNKVEWQDIVKVNGEYSLERFDVKFEDERLNDIEFLDTSEDAIITQLLDLEKGNRLDNFSFSEDDSLYDCSNFFSSVKEKYNLDEDDEIETYLFDNIDLPDEVCKKFDIAWLGGYINGVNI